MKQGLFALLKAVAICVCLVMAFQGRPPLEAQTVQDTEITDLNQHLTHTDGMVDADEKRLRDLELQMAEMAGEARVAYIILGLLSSGSLVLQVRVKHKETH